MSQHALSGALLAAVTAGLTAASNNPVLEPLSALGVSMAMGVVGGTVSALVMAGDASISVRRTAVCVLTTTMMAPMAVFTTLNLLYEGSLHVIPVVTTSGVAGLVTWPVTDKAARAFSAVSPKQFGQWLLDTARKILGGNR